MKILIIEFNDFHEEVILSQLNFLIKEKNTDIHLFINESLNNKIDFYKFLKNNLKINFISNKNSKWIKFIYLYKIKKYILENNIDIVVFNTYECKYIQILSNFIKKRKIAIIHNADKFLIKKTNKKINSFFVLNKTIFETIKNSKKNINVSYFYPLIEYNNEKKISNDKLKIVIPGLIELSRRDYLGFIELIKNINLEKFEFIFLGNILKNDGQIVYKMLEKKGLLNSIKIYKEFVSYEEYFSTISNSDLIMPLIHPNVKNFDKYHKTKITAAFTMAFSFKIPLFLYDSFKQLNEYKEFSIFYNFDSFIEKLNSLNRAKIDLLKIKMKLSKKISFDKEKEKYIKGLFN